MAPDDEDELDEDEPDDEDELDEDVLDELEPALLLEVDDTDEDEEVPELPFEVLPDEEAELELLAELLVADVALDE